MIVPSRLVVAAAVALRPIAMGPFGSATVVLALPVGSSSSDYLAGGGGGGDHPGEGSSRRGAAETEAAANPLGRSLQPPADGDFAAEAGTCGLCPVRRSALRAGDVVPTQSLRTSGWSFPPASDDYTCEEWDAYARDNLGDGTADCLDARDALMRQCCDGLPPLYRCSQDVQEMLGILSSSDYLDSNTIGEVGEAQKEPRRYQKSIPPIGDGETMNVHLIRDAGTVEIVDHGVGGGAVKASGTLTMTWTDNRLAWNASEAGCTSFRIVDTDIWTPGPIISFENEVGDEAEHELDAKTLLVMADGRVSRSRKRSAIANCEMLKDAAERCYIPYTEVVGGYRVEVTSEERGNWTMEGILGEEYMLNSDLSGMIRANNGDSGDNSLVGRFHFDPKGKSCNICGYGSAVLQPNVTLPLIPGAELKQDLGAASNCAEADAKLANLSVIDSICSNGRAALEETCCDDVASSFECESNIHDTVVEDLNTISPPDPSPREDDTNFSSKDFVDVILALDVLHIFDIDIKSSTMTLLVGLELIWYDNRLSWDPFIGGCHRISYRASIDAELTEIWVPEIELINQVQGVETLSEAHASVRYDGRVKWRRTGVLQSSCAFTGLESFPLDEPGCYLDFGATRDPLYHRIKYVVTPVEYSKRVEEHLGFQEYWLEADRTEVTTTTDEMSGFSNEAIRYQFYFSRATSYYVSAFILLYIMFTFLSFGMFFIDYSLGERLGYGSSILFVIVAQDITMSEKTPITDQMLWIYRLSFGSKVFVMLALLQSLIMLYIYSHGDYRYGEDAGEEQTRNEVHESGNTGEESLVDEEASPVDEDTRIDTDHENPSDTFSEEKQFAPSSADVQDEDGPIVSSKKRTMRARASSLARIIGRYDLISDKEDSEAVVKLKHLRRVDWLSALVFFLSYIVFLLIVFLVYS